MFENFRTLIVNFFSLHLHRICTLLEIMKGKVHSHQSVKQDFVTDAISGTFIGLYNMIQMLFLALTIHPLNFQDA